MKRATIIFAIIFTLTTLIPLIAYFRSTKENTNKEMVTIFSSSIEYPSDELSAHYG